MALNQSPKIVTDGLVFYYDMSNGKSFVGAPITNVLDGASVNGYPTYDNGWGTYNTNNYNGGAYFSIGTISSISGNIITTTSAHPLYTYNVVNPQSSGGGVTAGTNYIVKKLSSTSFSLHAWNGSQDGSQGYINPATGTHKVFDDFANDVRISVSASGFPTMWWGAPHVANSCLVKEIIPGGFTGILGRAATNCIRLHWIQPDGITDGMAYGPNGPVVAGQVYTVSFWTRSVTPSAVGQSLNYQIYNHGVVAAAGYGFSATNGPVGVWTKHSMTFTPVNPNCISYWFPSTGNMKVDLANIQFEAGSVANNFSPGTRTNTQAILDLTGTNTVTTNSLTYNSDGTFSFNGSNNFLSIPSSGIVTNNISIDIWFNVNSAKAYAALLGSNVTEKYEMLIKSASNLEISLAPGNYIQHNNILTINTWVNIVVSAPTGVAWKVYKNGVDLGTPPIIAGTYQVSGTGVSSIDQGRIRSDLSSFAFSGNIGSTKIYNRALSAAEVSQNFNAHRGRFGV